MRLKVKVTPGILFNLFLLGGFLAIVVTARDLIPQARLFPWAIGIPALAFTALQIILEQIRAQKPLEPEDTSGLMDLPVDRDTPPMVIVRRSAFTFGWVFGLFFGIWFFGFLISIPLFVLLYLTIMAKTKWYETAGLTGLILVFLVGVFHFILHVPWLDPIIPGPQDFIISVIGG